VYVEYVNRSKWQISGCNKLVASDADDQYQLSFVVLYLLQHNSCAIHVASQGKKDIVKMLLNAGCNVNAVDDVSYVLSLFIIISFFHFVAVVAY